MGEAAVKEPSMEDILSSIRKIISEEGASPNSQAAGSEVPDVNPEPQVTVPTQEAQTSDYTPEVSINPDEQAQPQEFQVGPDAMIEPTASDTPSGEEAARMASQLAGTTEPELADQTMQGSEQASNTWQDSTSQLQVEPLPETEMSVAAETLEPAPSLASIAQSVVEQPQVPSQEIVSPAPVAEIPAPEMRHVEMADATPAPNPTSTPTQEPVVSEAAIHETAQAVVEEEMAFRGALMSPSADGAVSNAFDRLKRSAMDDIDAKTEAILRPMLREWLDENLPNMVERLVREEIERVARSV